MVKQGIIKKVRQGIKGKTIRSKNKSELRIKCLIIKQDANDIPVFQVIYTIIIWHLIVLFFLLDLETRQIIIP